MRLAKNTVAQIVSSVLTLAASFVMTAIIARTAGVEVLGRYSFILVFTSQFAFACDAGLGMLLIPEAARRAGHIRQLLTNALSLSLMLSAATLLVIMAIGLSLGYSTAVLLSLGLAALWMILGVFLGLYSGVFYGLQRMEYATLAVLVEKAVVLAGLGLMLVARASQLNTFLAVLIISRVAGLTVTTGLHARLGLGWATMDLSGFGSLLRQAMPFGLNILLANIYLQSDVVLLAFFRGEAEVGFYKAANTFFYPLIILATSINNSLLPILSQGHDSQPDRSAFLLRKSFHYLLALGFPMAVGLYAIGPSLLPAALGAAYEPAVSALRILCWAIPLRFVNQTCAMALTSIKQQAYRTRAVGVGAAFNVLSNLIALPLFGFAGAAATTFLTEVVIFGCLYARVRREVGRLPLWQTGWRVLLGGAAVWAVSWAFGREGWLAAVAVAPAAYGLALYSVGGIPRADLAALAASVGRPRWARNQENLRRL